MQKGQTTIYGSKNIHLAKVWVSMSLDLSMDLSIDQLAMDQLVHRPAVHRPAVHRPVLGQVHGQLV